LQKQVTEYVSCTHKIINQNRNSSANFPANKQDHINQHKTIMDESSESYPVYLMAQNLNNRAASLIESGEFDIAIEDLTNAMRLSQQEMRPSCECHSCTLEASMAFSKHAGQRQNRMDVNKEDNTNQGFIFQQPIRVSPDSMSHAMGLILPLMITYNLALAHQLSAMHEEFSSLDRRRKLQRSLKLYELAYRWQMEEEVQSLGFNMILANNLGEIHRAADNKLKFVKCMQHLLSTMMYVLVVDDEDEVIEMDGFFDNTSSLFFNGGCAGAA
jgi:tetratricopeptide (TPR) repeat protein